jgi:hypothetical protein
MHKLMKSALLGLVLLVLANSNVCLAKEPALPIASGQYKFEHRFAEQPNMKSIPLLAVIKGRKIALINQTRSKVFPYGNIADGTLMWHAASKQWIIGSSKADRTAPYVGGCSDGPDVVDLKRKIYWTC